MKPKIWNDITNILAKLASSKDYDPKVKYETSLEYYGNQIPVLPKPGANDNGKGVFAKTDGTFELKNASDANSVHYTADTGKTDAQKAQARTNIDAVGIYEPTIVNPTFVSDLEADGVYFEVYYNNGVPELNIFGSYGDEPVRLCDIENPVQEYQAANKRYVDGNKVNVTGTTPSITPVANTHYKCNELASLTVTQSLATGAFTVVFTSGATPTTTSFPAAILGLENFAAEANTLYEINVLDNRAVVGSWAVSSGE